MTVCLCSHPARDHADFGFGACECGCPEMRPGCPQTLQTIQGHQTGAVKPGGSK